MSVNPAAAGIGRFTAIVLGLVVFVCVAMIGGTGYLKYQLDRAGTVLAAPNAVLDGNQDALGQLRRNWGYGGFMGLAQKYVATRDASGFAEMKTLIKAADDLVAQLPDRTPVETRRELTSVAELFDSAMQKISAPSGDALGEFTAADLAPLAAALPVLDAHAASGNAETRIGAQNKVQFWAMLLTLVSWSSLIVAAACAAGIFLTLRDKHSAPMRALAQSIQNMAHGDMRTAIWGIERQDMIGELARAVDIARYHFSHLPDVSLLSEQGPIRMRFEGETRSLFEAMMKAISNDSHNIREQSSTLTDTVKQQKESLAALAAKVEAILSSVAQQGQNGDQQVKQAIAEMVGSAESLKNAHAHAADQLNRLIPPIQERAQGLAEITQITGKQISQTLQSLASSEISLKANAEQAKDTLTKLSSTADDLSERLFGAINLLQASGKVMAETTENIKSRLGESAAPPPVQDASLAPWIERLEDIALRLASAQTVRDEPSGATDITPLSDQLERITSQLAALQASAYEQAPEQIFSQGDTEQGAKVAAALSELKSLMIAQNGVAALGEKITELTDLNGRVAVFTSALPGDLRQALREELQGVATLNDKIAELTELNGRVAVFTSALPGDLRQALREEMQNVSPSSEDAAEGETPQSACAFSPELQDQFRDQWFQMSAQIEASRASVVQTLADHIDGIETRLSAKPAMVPTKTTADYALQIQIEKQTQILMELVSTLSLIDEHMRQMKAEVA